MNSNHRVILPHEKDVNYRSYFYPLFFLCTTALLIITLSFWLSDYNSFEIAYTNWQKDTFINMNRLLNEFISGSVWEQITLLGNAVVLMLLLSPLLLYRRYIWLAMMAAAPIAGIFSIVGKNLMQIPRPAAVLEPTNFYITGEILKAHNSLPSGHTITIFACFSVLLILGRPITKKIFSERLANYQSLLLILLAIFFALSRVAVGAHWQLDVLFGALVGSTAGTLGVLLSLHFFKRKHFGKKSAVSVLILLAVLTLIAIYEYSNHKDTMLLLAAITGIFTLCISIYRIKRS